jgi:predicted AAA+ superfamily ATPase
MDYLVRIVDPLLDELVGQVPAIFITGPRATGKTTTAARRAATVVRLDREAEAVAFRADPDAALRGLPEPVLLDEWQLVPGVLGAVKRSVDADPRPGRFLVTGSARSELEGDLWPGTGRLVRVPMVGMAVREQAGAGGAAAFLDRLAAGDDIAPAADSPDLRGYVELLLRGGFPEAALRMGELARRHWLDSYVDHLVTRDARQVEGGRDPVRLRRYLEAYALNTAGVVEEKTLLEAAGINRRTAHAYERLLGGLLVVDSLPAWVSNRLKRLVLTPKRHLVDPALAGGVLRLNADTVLRDGDLLGRLLDTFVLAQVRAELPVTAGRPRLYHVRQQQGRFEIDLLAELAGGGLVGMEVKATASPGPADARHLTALRDRYPDRFVAGVVLHTGPRTFVLGERLLAAPISALWGSAADGRRT